MTGTLTDEGQREEGFVLGHSASGPPARMLGTPFHRGRECGGAG